jgi:hypothetical protein
MESRDAANLVESDECNEWTDAESRFEIRKLTAFWRTAGRSGDTGGYDVRAKLHMQTSAKGKKNAHDDDDKRWPICEGWIENTKFRRRHLAWRIEVLCATRISRLKLLLLFWSNSFSSAARPDRWLSPRPRRPGPSSARGLPASLMALSHWILACLSSHPRWSPAVAGVP